MDPLDRLFLLHRLFQSRRTPVSLDDICAELECARATAKRYIARLRDLLGAPIENVRGKGYRYAPGARFELPGLWFRPEELAALIALLRLVDEVSAPLAEALAPVAEHVERLLARYRMEHLRGRLRELTPARRARQSAALPVVCAALAQRRRLAFTYRARGDGKKEPTSREVSPQRLVLYRGNWYLDAWCHLRHDYRTFALDRMQDARIGELPAEMHALAEVEKALDGGYGIFAGEARHWAVLRVVPERAEWIADECWHPRQKGRWLPDGSYELRVPFSDPTELVLDICRYGPDVEVLAPDFLRELVAERHAKAAAIYARGKGSGFEPKGE